MNIGKHLLARDGGPYFDWLIPYLLRQSFNKSLKIGGICHGTTTIILDYATSLSQFLWGTLGLRVRAFFSHRCLVGVAAVGTSLGTLPNIAHYYIKTEADVLSH